MPVTSMTGFGRGVAAAEGWRVDVELSAVNRKQFDVAVGLPRELAALESQVQALIHARIRRGFVKGTIRLQSAAGAVSAANRETARAQIAALRELAAELALPDDLTASTLLRLPQPALASEAGGARSESVWPLLESALRQALDALAAMRSAEGLALADDLRSRLERLRTILPAVHLRAPQVTADYRAALARRVATAGVPILADDPALLREIALFADRCDISEELTRLASHFAQADSLLASAEPCGRALDFLCQELFREINTVGAKANDAELAALVIRFKADLEAFREQVQNVE